MSSAECQRTPKNPLVNAKVGELLRAIDGYDEPATAAALKLAPYVFVRPGDLRAERNKVRAAYNRAQRLAERRALMQEWGDYLDSLRENGLPQPHREP